MRDVTTELPVIEVAPNGCAGHCCAAFYLPHTITTMRRGWFERDGQRYALEEAEQIADMLIPLTPKQARERLASLGSPGAERIRWSRRGHHFTCRHWDEESGRCGIYETRPKMCSRYPYGRGCEHGCACEGEPSPEAPQ